MLQIMKKSYVVAASKRSNSCLFIPVVFPVKCLSYLKIKQIKYFNCHFFPVYEVKFYLTFIIGVLSAEEGSNKLQLVENTSIAQPSTKRTKPTSRFIAACCSKMFKKLLL